MNKNEEKILNLKPTQFDEYFFTDWLPPNFANYQKFHIERVEIYKEHMFLPLPPHRRSVCFFMYLTNGFAVRSKGLSKYKIEAGQFFFLPANQITNIDAISEDARGFYCHFQPEIIFDANFYLDFEATFPFFQIASEPIIQIENSYRIEKIIEIIEDEYHKSKDQSISLISIYLMALFTELKINSTLKELASINASARVTQLYKNALSIHVRNKRTISEFAEYLSITPNHLHKCVKTATGKSAHDLLNEMRILESKVLLKQTNLNIGEIAFKVGQFGTSDFSRLFKKATSLTPKEYRNTKFD